MCISCHFTVISTIHLSKWSVLQGYTWWLYVDCVKTIIAVTRLSSLSLSLSVWGGMSVINSLRWNAVGAWDVREHGWGLHTHCTASASALPLFVHWDSRTPGWSMGHSTALCNTTSFPVPDWHARKASITQIGTDGLWLSGVCKCGVFSFSVLRGGQYWQNILYRCSCKPCIMIYVTKSMFL